MSIEAMKQARSVISSINSGRQHEIKKNGETVFWQREEWVRWGLDEVLPLIDQAIAEAEKQEPDKYVMDIECTKCGAQQSGILTVNTTPQQRTWVGLTDEEAEAIWEDHQFNGRPSEVSFANRMNLMQAIEAKLKEKNT